MPLDLAQLLARTARVEVAYAGETFGVEYLPHALTADLQARLSSSVTAATDDPAQAVRGLLELIPLLVADWEIESDGAPVPVDASALGGFPLGLLAAIATAITSDLADPNRVATEGAAETPSSSGSSRGALSALRPTGTG